MHKGAHLSKVPNRTVVFVFVKPSKRRENVVVVVNKVTGLGMGDFDLDPERGLPVDLQTLCTNTGKIAFYTHNELKLTWRFLEKGLSIGLSIHDVPVGHHSPSVINERYLAVSIEPKKDHSQVPER